MNSVSGHTTPANITQLNVANSRISHVHFRKSVLIPKLCALRLHYAPPRRRENSKMAFHPTSFPSLFLPAQSITSKRGGRFFTVSFKIVLILKKPRTNRPRYSPFACDAPTLFFVRGIRQRTQKRPVTLQVRLVGGHGRCQSGYRRSYGVQC